MTTRSVNIQIQAEDRASPVVKQSADRMERSLRRAAASITNRVMRPTERYNQELAKLRGHLDAGRISQETFNRAAQQSKARLDEATKGVSKMGKTGTSVFSSMGTGLASVVGGYASLGGAITAVIGLLRQQQEEARKAAQAGRQSEFSLASLAQLADEQDSFGSLSERAKQLFARGGADDLSQAGQVVFSIKSAGQLQDLDVFEQLASSGVVRDVGSLSQSAAALVKSLGAEETGSVRELISKAFAASAASPATVPELLSAAARSGTSAAALGISDEEILSATAITATATGSAEQGGTQVAALLKALEKQGGFEGKTLQESLVEIQAKNLAAKELFEFFGRSEGVTAFRLLTENADDLATNLKNITAAQSQDLAKQRAELAGSDPALAASRAAREAEAELELAQRRRGTATNRADAVVAQLQTQQEQVASQLPPILREQQRLTDSITNSSVALARLVVGDEMLNELRDLRKAITDNTESTKARGPMGGMSDAQVRDLQGRVAAGQVSAGEVPEVKPMAQEVELDAQSFIRRLGRGDVTDQERAQAQAAGDQLFGLAGAGLRGAMGLAGSARDALGQGVERGAAAADAAVRSRLTDGAFAGEGLTGSLGEFFSENFRRLFSPDAGPLGVNLPDNIELGGELADLSSLDGRIRGGETPGLTAVESRTLVGGRFDKQGQARAEERKEARELKKEVAELKAATKEIVTAVGALLEEFVATPIVRTLGATD